MPVGLAERVVMAAPERRLRYVCNPSRRARNERRTGSLVELALSEAVNPHA